MTAPADRAAALGPTCRHYQGRLALDGKCCGIGHPIDKIVAKANGNSIAGIAYMMPCKPGPERKADCPDYDPKTPEEIEANKVALRASMAKFSAGLPAIDTLRSTMIAEKITQQITTCPWCNGQRLHVTCAIGINDHMSAACEDCGMGFRE